ncbi:MAG TPA: hypothetical protein VMR19_02595 [Candidatus Saccharimonadales bacterium]|jgi:hypothetical protein|nr:hypothetical protein [Candidatus Saccharimonadales bacterium]
MKETTYPSWAMGYAMKILAFDEAEGCGSRVAKTAFELFKKRQEANLPGSPETDWKKAEQIVQKEYAGEILRRLA